MAQPRTARERARVALTGDIKNLALRQLADSGAGDLSLRAIARELGMASSALYRYFRSRDELLTALIIDAYDDLADAMAAADAAVPVERHRQRWIAMCATMRTWARTESHRFALIYGSPVPGYRAPADTITPAVRVMTAFAQAVQDAAVAGSYADEGPADIADTELAAQLDRVRRQLGPEIPAAVLSRLVAAFAQTIGMINLELAGHFVGGFEPTDALFRHAIEELADTLPLRNHTT